MAALSTKRKALQVWLTEADIPVAIVTPYQCEPTPERVDEELENRIRIANLLPLHHKFNPIFCLPGQRFTGFMCQCNFLAQYVRDEGKRKNTNRIALSLRKKYKLIRRQRLQVLASRSAQ